MRLCVILSVIVYCLSCAKENKKQSWLPPNLSGVPKEKKRNTYTDFETLNPVQENAGEYGVDYMKRKKLTGDFNGDGNEEILYESLMSRNTGKQIDSIVFKNFVGGNYWPYEGEVDALQELDPVLKLKCPDGINELKLSNHWQVFGILAMINMGNINKSPGDEIALVINWADWSSMNSCELFSYCDDQWQQVFSFSTRDWSLFENNAAHPDLSCILKQRDTIWHYYYQDFLGEVDSEWRVIDSCECQN